VTAVCPSCVICTTEREATHGYLCTAHFERLAGALRDIEDQAASLDPVPSMAQRSGSGGGTLASHRAPARLDVLVHTDRRSRPAGARRPGPACSECWHDTCTDIRTWLDAYDAHALDTLAVLDVLHSWARITREERALADPQTVTVTGERDTLTRQLEWIAAQPWVDEMYADTQTLLGQLVTINRTGPDRPVGRCYLPAATEDGTCGGHIWRTEQPAMPWVSLTDRCTRITVETADGPAYCDRCAAQWEGKAALKRLELIAELEREAGRPHTDDGRPMLTAYELAERFGTSVNAVRLRLSRARIKAVGSHYHPDALSKVTA
jgi:hypothetical protein